MNFFRNTEVRRSLIIFICVTAAATAAAIIYDDRFGMFTFAVCFIFTALFAAITYRRYRRICRLSCQIDKILHGQEETLNLSAFSEGVISILESEVQKMTVRLREQKQNLQDDKIYLADSIADISHQIRTPLTSINLLVQLLKEPDITDERRTEILRELQTLLSRIEWLITTLLKISKLDAGTVPLKHEEIDFSSLIQNATEPLQVPIELREQELEIIADGKFTGDLDWTSEAVGNIVKNCMEHTPNGGKIKITAAENALFSEILIEDTGCGIDKEDLPHIFERFYKGKNSTGSSFGIGLALARVIVSKQNGILKAENKNSGGAIFTMRFYKGIV